MKRETKVILAVTSFFLLATTPVAMAQQLGDKASQKDAIYGPSKLKIPRFVATSDKKSNMRSGPSRDYPVTWVYRREDYPLEVIDEFGLWRKVRDIDGTTGWMLVKILTGARYALIVGQTRKLYQEPTSASKVTLIAEAGVVGKVTACKANMCELEINGTKGWLEKAYLYGVYKEEIF